MDLEQARQFLREHHRAVLATFRRDGRPQLSPVSVALDAEGRPSISSRETAYKVKNIRRDPRASLCVFGEEFVGAGWVQIDGRAEIVSLPDAMELLVYQYRQVAGEHPDWDDFRQAMEHQRRVIVRINIVRAGPDRQG